MHVVVLGGMARVGKTDVCDLLEMEAAMEGYEVKRVSFASPLKEAVAAEHGYGDDWRKFKAEKPEEYRTQCQDIGASRRAEDPDYWVNKWNEKLAELQKEELVGEDLGGEFAEYLILVDDCRYPNELEAAKKWDALTMFVYAGKRAAKLPEIDADWRAHESEEMSQRIEAFTEGYTDLFEWSLFNDKGTIELERKINERLPHFLGLHASRYGRKCECNECKAFRSDIQVEELTEHFREALDEVFKDDTLPDDFKESIREAFEDIIDDLESGKKAPMDFFRSGWWEKALEDYGLEVEDPYEDEDPDDSDS